MARQLCFVLAAMTMAACLTFGGDLPFGGEGEKCWTDPKVSPCDSGLECHDGRCQKPGPCTVSLDCLTDKACVSGTCASYASTCATDSDCRADYYCRQGTCLKRRANAGECTEANQCLSNFCADNVCCAQVCNGVCLACVAWKTGEADGTCALIAAGTDPDDECFGSATCGTTGACDLKPLGTACTDARECATGFCSDHVCCNGACDQTCQKCGADGKCVPVISAEDPGTCDDANVRGDCTERPCKCNAAGTCTAGSGTICDFSSQCGDPGAICVDHVCCKSACDAKCWSCAASKTGELSGTCAPVLDRTDPDDDCSGATECNGNGACYAVANGRACNGNYECASGYCSTWRETGANPNAWYNTPPPRKCCDPTCNNKCYSCFGSDTGGADGVCGPVKCADAGTCNNSLYGGDGYCKYPTGSDCSFHGDAICASGSCVCSSDSNCKCL